VCAHLDAQYRLGCLGAGRFPCGHHGNKGANQSKGKDVSTLIHGALLFAQGL
jgi:hypothetical protein